MVALKALQSNNRKQGRRPFHSACNSINPAPPLAGAPPPPSQRKAHLPASRPSPSPLPYANSSACHVAPPPILAPPPCSPLSVIAPPIYEHHRRLPVTAHARQICDMLIYPLPSSFAPAPPWLALQHPDDEAVGGDAEGGFRRQEIQPRTR
ncbi:classical arabinogalactan protein 9-like [Penaeus monodon]|uniref:classical arabinogalactan protein 9-like n=1 Tax=Penaeus monodon TaxID=6687 RepID=UPI0018A7CFFE|nr:classical arabinogalactan protein 9-like [Penaeus monodon]